MRKPLALVLFISLAIAANAQSGKGFSLTVGPELYIPFNTTTFDYGNVRSVYQDGVGAVIKAELPLSKTVFFTGSVGYAWYAGKAYLYFDTPGPNGADVNESGAPSYKFVPLKAGLNYYFVNALYIGGECGFAIGANNNSDTHFIYSGGLGTVIPLSTHGGLDLHIRYERGFEVYYYPLSMSQLSIGAAYKFGW